MKDQLIFEHREPNGREPDGLVHAHQPPPHPAPRFDDLDEGPDWRRALGAVRRHAGLVLAVAALGAIATVFVARRIQPTFRATATIWIASQNEARGAHLGPIRQDQLLQWESWIDLLRSYAILDPVVLDLHLNVAPADPVDSALFRNFSSTGAVKAGTYTLSITDDGAWSLKARGHAGVEFGSLGDSIGKASGFLWALPRDPALFGRRIRFGVVTHRTAAEQLAQGLNPRVDRNGAFLKVDLEGPSPTQTAMVLNAILTRYVQTAADLKRRRLGEFARNLEEQRADAQEGLDHAERDLEAFRVRNVGLPRIEDPGLIRTGGVDRSPLAADADELDRVRRDRQAIGAWLAAAPGARSSAGPLLSDAAMTPDLRSALDELARKRADLRALRFRYEDAYPAVQHLNGEVQAMATEAVPTIVRQLDADLTTRERLLATRVAARTDTLRTIPPRLLEEARLTRAATLAAELYTSVQQRYQEAQLALASSLPDVSVLDPAVPAQLPFSDSSTRALLLGLITSLGIAVVLAVGLDKFDPRVRYPAEVSRRMGLNILGAVPHLRAGRGNEPLTPDAAEEVTEALRGVRVALTHSGPVARPLMFTVSSSGPGDGKSFITSNLGISFALAGYRTLVIDGDVRRGALHRAFGAQRTPGLTDCLRGAVKARDAVQTTPFESLGLLGSGTRTRSAPELLGGPHMQELLDELKPDFDVIICDSPPLSAGVDPYLLGSVTGSMLIVLRTGVSVRSILEAKLAVLAQLPVRVMGAVLNAVPRDSLYQPYSYYVPGYQVTDEAEPALPSTTAAAPASASGGQSGAG